MHELIDIGAVVGVQGGVGAVLVWALMLAIVVIVALMLIGALRRRLIAGSEEGGGVGFALHEARAMHRRGEITEQEFQSLREAVLKNAASERNAEKSRPGRANNNVARRQGRGVDLTGDPLPEPMKHGVQGSEKGESGDTET